MGITITNCWKLFRYGVNRDHYEKLIGIRELSEQLLQYCFNNTFSPDSGTPENNSSPLDELDDGDTVSTCCALHFTSCISPSAAASNISNITQYSASSISIGSQNISEREESREGEIYNTLTSGYCLGRLPNGNKCLKTSLWFCKGCNRFNKKTYYC